jgi:hypothetical protein
MISEQGPVACSCEETLSSVTVTEIIQYLPIQLTVNSQGRGRKLCLPSLRYHLGICPEVLHKTTENLSQDCVCVCVCPGWDFKGSYKIDGNFCVHEQLLYCQQGMLHRVNDKLYFKLQMIYC